jgi:aspartate kinase
MKVFKFGGASVKDAEAVRNVANILNGYKNDKLLVVISAMGKTTNMLEELVKVYFDKHADTFKVIEKIKEFHWNILTELFEDKNHPIYNEIENLFLELECMVEKEVGKGDYDFFYDQVVSSGEFISTKIVSAYLLSSGLKNKWIDARNFIFTDSNYREARINWVQTERIVTNRLKPFIEKSLVITQGFIGKDHENATTTLGREGSDYSAAIFAWCLNAESVTIWKDVAGVMNADPKKMEKVVKIDRLTYNQAIELAYYGASVIHPKTLQPLKSKSIPFFVKSFVDKDAKGTAISENPEDQTNVTCYIFKENQYMINLSTKDFSFIAENNLQDIFRVFASNKIRINTMQNSAISFRAVFDYDERKITHAIEELRNAFNIKEEKDLKLITIYNPSNKENNVKFPTPILEQLTEKVQQLVVRELAMES